VKIKTSVGLQFPLWRRQSTGSGGRQRRKFPKANQGKQARRSLEYIIVIMYAHMRTLHQVQVSKNLWLVTDRPKTGITAYRCRDSHVPICSSMLMAVYHLQLHHEHFP